MCTVYGVFLCFFFQAEDGIRDLVRSRGLGDVYKRQFPHPVDAADQPLNHQRAVTRDTESETR